MRPAPWTQTSNCGAVVAADLRSRVPSVKWSENWRRRRILPRDGWRSHGCQSHSRRSLPVGDRSAHVESVEPGSEGPMPALWEARVVMEVCKVDLGFALSEAFIEGCREARADLRYEGRNRSGTLASLRELVHLVRRRDIDGPVHRGTARTWRRGSRSPLPRYTRMQADCGLYFELHLYNMGFLGGLSHTHTNTHIAIGGSGA